MSLTTCDQAPYLDVVFLQKVYTEHVLSHEHHVWDVHTNVDRWWVITNPTNLYSQDQFPNMDLAVTFHVGLCLRIPRSEKRNWSGDLIAPLAECYRLAGEAADALAHAHEVSDYQTIGVRCREALLAFSSAAQVLVPWGSSEPAPKQADFKAWVDHICSVSMAGEKQKQRRQLFKSLLDSAWHFSNWLIHSKSSSWFDAEAATSTLEVVISLASSAVLRHTRGVPETCPACGSNRLSPQRGERVDLPGVQWERPSCDKCGWTGAPVPILEEIEHYLEDEKPAAEVSEPHVIPKVPLMRLMKPGDRKS